MAEILHPTQENFDDLLRKNHLVLVENGGAGYRAAGESVPGESSGC